MVKNGQFVLCGKMVNILLSAVLVFSLPSIHGKYVEGHLKTLDDWAFVARFCFLSGRGRYEYQIEYEKRYGELQLLLYYDDKSQWPSVYKTGKTCQEKLSVLSIQDNQIVALSPRSPYNIYSGCFLRTPTTKEEELSPTPSPKDKNQQETTPSDAEDQTYFDQFLISSSTTSYYDVDTNITLFNVTNLSSYINESSLFLTDMERFNNNLENSTEYRNDVEELFEESNKKESRVRRAIPKLFDFEKKNTLIVSCRNFGGFTSSRERWWYIALSNCGSGKGIDVKYRFRMTNGAPGDFWHEHFSADEMYIPPILMAESIAYTMLLVAIFLCAIELKTRQLYHCTYRLFSLSATLQWFGVLLQSVTWSKYAVSGIGPYTTLGGLFVGASEITFLLLLLLMAKGYTITRARLSTCSTVKITVFINVYTVVYISLFIYQSEAFDPGDVLNLYESPAGFGLAGLRCASWGVFICSCASTIRKYQEKGAFYYPFGLLGSMWILSGSILTFVGVSVLDAWVRESVMHGALAAIAFGGHSAFLWLTWPSRANKSFPYHVRTNHVGISADDDGADYPRHTYEPSLPESNSVIPISRRTEELLNGVYTQYLRERDYHNNAPATPMNYISFPENLPNPQPTAPPAHKPFENEHITETGEFVEESQTPVQNDFENENVLPGDNPDALVDSGHPSFDASVSNSPNETKAPSVQGSPKKEIIIVSNTDLKSDKHILKHNPFIVSNEKRPPNKVILEPLEYPLRSPTKTNGTNVSNGVPKHLFAAKRQEV